MSMMTISYEWRVKSVNSQREAKKKPHTSFALVKLFFAFPRIERFHSSRIVVLFLFIDYWI